VGIVFQFFQLLPTLTALENAVLPLDFAHAGSKNERFARGAHNLELVGLGDKLDHLPSELSGGEQQRVAIARALVTQPTILFADEPTGNLDSKTSGEILDLLRASADDYGQTIVMVTHEPRAASIADRILFLADGLIVKELLEADSGEVLSVMSTL
jgi:putative ABC transport system ATP-binding protein